MTWAVEGESSFLGKASGVILATRAEDTKGQARTESLRNNM